MAGAEDVAMDMMSVVGGEDTARSSIGSATLFDYAMASSYNSSAMAATSAATAVSSEAASVQSIGSTRTKPTTVSVLPLETDGGMGDKKTGRPSHPAWDHFVRGEKRNRFHHHAYCKYCTAHGAEAQPVRGVSGNMIRHLQKCVYCPPEIVAELRVLCAQKDAVNFNKRHHPNPASQTPLTAEAILQASAISPASGSAAEQGPTKKFKKMAESEGGATGGQAVLQPSTASSTAVENVFSTLQIPIDMAALGHVTQLPGRSTTMASKIQAHKPRSLSKVKQNVDQSVLDEHVIRATLSGGLPFDWIAMEEATRLAAVLTADDASSDGGPGTLRTAVYDGTLLGSLSTHVHDAQMIRVREEATSGGSGVTLAISYWFNKAERTNMLMFSVITAAGEATAWQLVDVGTEDVLLEELSSQIRAAVLALAEDGVPVIAIVADSLLAYAAAKAAMSSGDDPQPLISVFPSFEAFLINALGVVLTISEAHVETMGHVTDLVGAFSTKQIREMLRRECGDTEAALVLPRKDKWFSFIDCIDSVRQFEDTIKIIGQRSGADDGTSHSLSARVQETIQNTQFWENVVSLSELMSPIKETYKLMLSNTSAGSTNGSTRSSVCAVMTFSLSNVFYQLGRMYQQYTAIMADWEENPSPSRIISHVRHLQEQVNKTWKLYDQPLMILAYTFDYNMAHPLLARNLPSLQWLSIAKYAKEYFRRWFSLAGSTRRSSLGEESLAHFLEELLTFKERKYPFDADSVSDLEFPRSFYQLISDSNPMMHLFGARLFSFATSVPQLSTVIPSKSSVARIATFPCSPTMLFPLIQLKLRPLTSHRMYNSKDLLAQLQPGRGAKRGSATGINGHEGQQPKEPATLQSGLDASAVGSIWTAREWRLVAKQWKIEWEHEGNVGNVLDTVAGLNATTALSSRLQVEVLSLDQLFKEKLPSRLQQSREEEAVVDV